MNGRDHYGFSNLIRLKAVTMTKLQLELSAAIVVAKRADNSGDSTSAPVKLREENQSLRQQIAQLKPTLERLSNRVNSSKGCALPRLPAPPMQSPYPQVHWRRRFTAPICMPD